MPWVREEKDSWIGLYEELQLSPKYDLYGVSSGPGWEPWTLVSLIPPLHVISMPIFCLLQADPTHAVPSSDLDTDLELKIWIWFSNPLERQGISWLSLPQTQWNKNKMWNELEDPLVLPCGQGLDGTPKCRETKEQGESSASWRLGTCHPSPSPLPNILAAWGSLSIRENF